MSRSIGSRIKSLFSSGKPAPAAAPPEDVRLGAEAGDAEAQNALGRWYADNTAETAVAGAWFMRAAEQGFVRAKHNLGVLALQAGQREPAAEWFLTAAKEGWTPSLAAIGAMFEGEGNLRGALKFFEMAAEQGHADAQDALGRLLLADDDPELYEAARAWSEKAADQGHSSAQTRLGTIYHEGLGVTRDPERSASWFLSAARQGHPGAQGMIGVALHLGIGIAADRVESAFWLSRSKAQGNEIGRVYLPEVEAELTAEDRRALEARLRQP
ncbi:tetratricopeptide repeat protein [Phreatobacter stygius]|uniref:Sel1 repeat family protein n=1 Tax=Phreatobacter stygius TaxID=1940610 RepID=A0A4D7BBX7_9HYPH|nr:tetratricopeptide repeat protein [Phreatobacter stygius]QCI68270.1 sel1 repeat family protein [Phreatobacter stygius]